MTGRSRGESAAPAHRRKLPIGGTPAQANGWSLAGLYPVSFERATLRVIEHDAVLVRTPISR